MPSDSEGADMAGNPELTPNNSLSTPVESGSQLPTKSHIRERERKRENRRKRRKLFAQNQHETSSGTDTLPGSPAPNYTILVSAGVDDDTLGALEGKDLREQIISTDTEQHTPLGTAKDESSTPSQLRERQRKTTKREEKRRIEHLRDLLRFGSAKVDLEEISGWSPEQVIEEAEKLQGAETLSDDRKRVWSTDLGRRSRRLNSQSPSRFKGQVPDLSPEAMRAERWTVVDNGTMYGWKLDEHGQKVLVFAANFCPYSEMTAEELDDIDFLAQHFHQLGRLFRPVTTNGAHVGGLMFAEGWRAGFDPLHSLGIYVWARTGAGTKEEYAQFILDMERASAIYAKRYKALAPREYLASQGYVEMVGVPRFGTSEVDSTAAQSSYGSNLTVTWGDFYNKYHLDRDAQPRAAGSWFVTNDHGNRVTDPTQIREAVDGGLFALPEYRLAIDFGACPGVVDLMWSSKEDLHATSLSTTKPGFRRIGTSVQVPLTTLKAQERMKHLHPSDRPIAGLEIRMMELQLKLPKREEREIPSSITP